MGEPASPERPKEKPPEVKELEKMLQEHQIALNDANLKITELAEKNKVTEQAKKELDQLRQEIKTMRKIQGKEIPEVLSSEEKNLMVLFLAGKVLDPIRKKISDLYQKHPDKKAVFLDMIEKASLSDPVLLAELLDINRRQEMNSHIEKWVKAGEHEQDVKASFEAIQKGGRPRSLSYAPGVEFPAMPQEIVLKLFFIEGLKGPNSPLEEIISEFRKNKNFDGFSQKTVELYREFINEKKLKSEQFFADDRETYKKLCAVADVQSERYWQDIYQISPAKLHTPSHFDPANPDMRYFPIAGVPIRGINAAVDRLGKWLKPDNLNDETRWTVSSMLLGAVQIAGAMTFVLNVGGAAFGQVWQTGKMLQNFRNPRQALRHFPIFGPDAWKALKSSLPAGRLLVAGAGFFISQGVIDPEKWDRWLSGRASFDGVLKGAALTANSPAEGLHEFGSWLKKNGKDFYKDAAKPTFEKYISDPATGVMNWSVERWNDMKQWASALKIIDQFTFPFEQYQAYFAVMKETKEFAKAELKKKNLQNLADQCSSPSKENFDGFLLSYFGKFENEKVVPQILLDDLKKAGFLKEDDVKGIADPGPFPVEKPLADKLMKQARWVKSQKNG